MSAKPVRILADVLASLDGRALAEIAAGVRKPLSDQQIASWQLDGLALAGLAVLPLDDLRAIAEDMDDYGNCPYFRRGEPGQDPEGICVYGCRDEPACQTNYEPPGWPSERLRLALREQWHSEQAVTEGQEEG